MSTQLGGTGRLADDLYLVAHHEITGKPHLQPRAAGVGLAGGLLAELMLAGSIRLWRGMIVPEGSAVSRDGLARAVLGQITSEREYLPPRAWLLFLARTSSARSWGRGLTRPVSGAAVRQPGALRRPTRRARQGLPMG